MDPFPHLTRDDRLLILAPHPDDESLATAGLLQRAAAAGTATRIIFLTDGDNNPWPQRIIERRWRVSGAVERARWGNMRRAEALAALQTLGHGPSAAEFWALPDQGLTHLLLSGGDAFVDKLCQAVAAWQPSHWIVPSPGDRHPDHSALGVAVDVAQRRMERSDRMPPVSVFSYIVHGDPKPPHARMLRLANAEQDAKRLAILCHHSQVMLSRGRFLAHAQPEEPFLVGLAMSRTNASHPGQRLCWDKNGLKIEWPTAGASQLLGAKPHLLTESMAGTLRHIALPDQRWMGRGTLRLPLAALCPETRYVFFKLARRFGLYSAPGWVRCAARDRSSGDP